jgi:hypothetical protein
MKIEIVRSKKRKKSISIKVEKDGTIVVRAPQGATDPQIKQVIKRKEDWINRKVKAQRHKQREVVEHNYEEGEKFLYLGEEYELRFVRDGSLESGENILLEDYLYFDYDCVPRADEVFEDWYRKEALGIMESIAEEYDQYFAGKYEKIKISWAKKRWGSCTSAGNLNFNWRIIMAPIEVVRYVVVHELCHLVHHNHSRDFWEYVESFVPDYKRSKEWLKKNQHRLRL